MSRRADPSSPFQLGLISMTGLLAFATTHLAFLSQAGGFHYDESWAALFSHRIATEPGFWPVGAMSPYTSAWSHYVAALFFRLYGTSLFIYRVSGIFLVGAGLSFLYLALVRAGERRAAALLPWVVAFFPAAVLNHRFVIEINTFHVFCLGLFTWGVSLKLFPAPPSAAAYKKRISDGFADGMIAVAVLLGVTSHILFIAPALAAFGLLFWQRKPIPLQLRLSLLAILFVLFGFFLQIHLRIPEKDKSLALLILSGLCLLALLVPSWFHNLPRVIWKGALFSFMVLLVPALFFLFFFAEGSWSAAFFTGGLTDPRWIGLTLIVPIWGVWVWRRRSWSSEIKLALSWMALTLIIVTAIATKPAPRYFEIPLFLFATWLALALSRFSGRALAAALSIWIVSGALQLHFNYFRPALEGKIEERSFRFLFFRDNSSDTLPKQGLARFLAEQGCGFEQIGSDDIRLMDPLRFLSLGDWEVAPGASCRFGQKFRIARYNPGDVGGVRLGPFMAFPSPPGSFYTH